MPSWFLKDQASKAYNRTLASPDSHNLRAIRSHVNRSAARPFYHKEKIFLKENFWPAQKLFPLQTLKVDIKNALPPLLNKPFSIRLEIRISPDQLPIFT